MEETNETGNVVMQEEGALQTDNKEMLKDCRKHFSKLGLMFFLGTLVIYGAQYGVSKLVEAFKPEWLENINISLMLLSFIPLYLIGLPILIMLVKRLPGQAPKQHSMKVWQYILALIMCFSLMYVSNFIGTIITTIISMFKDSMVSNTIFDIATNTNLLLNLFYMVICAPIMEEYIFRKLVVDRTLRYGYGVAIVLSGLMFGLFHGNLNQFVYAFTMGMFLAFLYVRTGKLQYTIGIHMIVNFFGGIVSVLLLRGINMDAYMAAANSGSTEAIMAVVMESLAGWIAYMAYAFFIIMVAIAGIVLFIVFRKKFVLEKGGTEIPKGKRFQTVILNIGMVLYCLFWIYKIVEQLVV